ncbi:carbohydrate ABC transporter permease [Deinococcus peraridilitoris]|uniref:carbohydrate ABC transporter permease n=1 Tax=Deinococcus peraridilitoris TaxID=432329 RepID=UPI0002EE4349|nr:sugar ABC transporter permease [Deinococcus peraridilitoris]
MILPILSAFWYSVYDWDGLRRTEYIGLQNFRTVLFTPPYSTTTYTAFGHNVIVFLTLMVVQNGTAFFLAYFLSKQFRGFRFHQVVVFLPVILSTIIIGVQWKLLLNPLFGAFNMALSALNLSHLAQPWLGQESTALPALMLVNTWHWVGFPTLVFLAAIQRIPTELIEAARLDGASEGVLLRRIVWPLIAPAVTIIVILTFIGAFNWFELPYIMAGLDGPYGTDVLGLYFYRTAFGNVGSSFQNFGLGSALAVLMFLFILICSVILTRILRRRETEL